MTRCLECGDEIEVRTDLELCQECTDKFDLDTLWELHDEGKLDALDFNRSEKLRERLRKDPLRRAVEEVTSG